jgi:general stress protein 26
VTNEPEGELDQRYTTDGTEPTPWTAASALLAIAKVAWFTTSRPSGQPHMTPLYYVYVADRVFVHTGEEEQKAKNLAADPRCAFAVGTGSADHGLDVVLEARAEQITDRTDLQLVADALESKYGSAWHYDVGDGHLVQAAGTTPIVFEVVPTTAYGFTKGEPFSQTRWDFTRRASA